MKRVILLLVFLPLIAGAQLIENFDDGDFTSNPVWSGTTGKFMVNPTLQLQLNAAEAGNAWLSTPLTLVNGNMEWRFWIKLAFSPSANNFSEVYLVSDQADLSLPLTGFFLRFGEAGSNDAIELFHRQGSNITSICRGANGLIASSFELKVKVVRNEQGQWSVFADNGSSGIYSLEATGLSSQQLSGGFFGYYCQFTASNSTKMYYDDIYAGPEVVDNAPPVLLSATATTAASVRLVFDEAISSQTLADTTNYTISGGIGHPQQAIAGSNASEILLSLKKPLENGITYTLSLSGLKDLAGNLMPTTEVQLSFYTTKRNDVVINEIMADPTPVVGLPEFEYVELHNPTSVLINLNGFVLKVGTTAKPIGNVQITPGGYLLLSNETARPTLEPYGSFFGFSSFQLANSGAQLSLLSPEGLEISSINYSDTWYGDSKKAEGGWSLEQKDPTNPCGGASNWSASTNVSGGTPGSRNSIYGLDDSRPAISQIKLLSSRVVQLWFDHLMEPSSLTETTHYVLEPSGYQPVTATGNPADNRFVELSFSQDFEEGTLYKLFFSQDIVNCAGRPVSPDYFITFGLPQPAEPLDVVINEVLFHPFNGGVDFVELYNRSEKLINLEDLRLCSVRQTIPNPPDTTVKIIATSTLLLQPGEYALLTTSVKGVANFYPDARVDRFVVMPSFPTYSNDTGTVLLASKTGQMIDVMSYTEKMHYPLLNYFDGVSLERISFNRLSNDIKNWQSASQTTGFASPGYQNSAFISDENATSEEEIGVDPEVFSPDGDGYNDLTSIRWSFASGGYTLNIHIYSSSGQHVRHLTKSELISPTGAVSWNGLDDNGNKVPVGIYIVAAEAFNMEGKVKGFKKAVVVATR